MIGWVGFKALSMDRRKLSVAYLTPSWPLNSKPNGIVSYVNNITLGFEEEVNFNIFTRELTPGASGPFVFDLLEQERKRSLYSRLNDRVLFSQLNNQFIKDICRDYRATQECRTIINAINSAETEFDVLEVEESFGRAKFLVQQTNIPVVTRLHGPWFIHGPIMKLDHAEDYHWRVKTEGEGILASQGVTAPSMDVLNKVREYYELPLLDAKVIPNPVLPVPKEKQWRYDSGGNVSILVVGRFDLHKGGDLVLDAFDIIASKNKDVDLIFVGPDRGVIIDHVEYDFYGYVDKFIKTNSIKKRIRFLGYCSPEEIAELRRNTTITVMPSRYETFSISMVEALAAGSPVVASAVGAISELVIDGFNGLLAEPESAESIADNVLKLLDDPGKMKELSANAIEDSIRKYSPAVVAEKTEAYYRSLLAC